MVYRGEGRKRLRLENYNYSGEGGYFLTFCTKGRIQYFGEIVDGKMILNEYGKVLEKIIQETIHIRKEIILDEYVIMPNHVHVLVFVKNSNPNPNNNPVGNAGMRSLGKDKTKNHISNYIQGLKSSCTREIRKEYNDYEFAWQKSVYDVIIRNDEQLIKSREYIICNPEKWENDVNNN